MNQIRSTMLLALLIPLLISTTAAVAQPARLIHRWSPGEPTRYELNETMKQAITGPISSDLDWKRTIEYTERVLKETETGTRIERRFDRVRLSVSRDGDAPETYDSEIPNAVATKSILIAPFVGFAGKSVRLTINDDGTVSDIEGAADVLDAVFSPFESSDLLGGGVTGAKQSPDRNQRIARQIEQALQIIPGRLVRTGERWPVEIDHESPIPGDLASDLVATLKGRDRQSGHADITIDGDLTLKADEQEAPSLTGLLGITLESGDFDGRIRFDDEAGRIESSTMQLNTTWTVGGGLLGGDEPMKQRIEQRAELKRLP